MMLFLFLFLNLSLFLLCVYYVQYLTNLTSQCSVTSPSFLWSCRNGAHYLSKHKLFLEGDCCCVSSFHSRNHLSDWRRSSLSRCTGTPQTDDAFTDVPLDLQNKMKTNVCTTKLNFMNSERKGWIKWCEIINSLSAHEEINMLRIKMLRSFQSAVSILPESISQLILLLLNN